MCVAFSFILQAQVDKERERKQCIPSAPCAIQRTERSGCGNSARWLPCTGGSRQSTVHHLSKQADATPPSLLLFPQQRSLQEDWGKKVRR